MGRIRPLEPADIEPLSKALTLLPLLARYGSDATKLAAQLARARERGDRLSVYELEGPAGLAWSIAGAGFGLGGYLRLLAVAGSAQGRGVGAALLADFEAATFAVSAHACLLVSDFNTRAQAFYRTAGYQQVGALPGLVLADVTELIYWKRRAALPTSS